MAGTKQGGLKAAQKNLANNPNFYAEIGAKGGRNGKTGGFAQDIECDCDLIDGPHFVKKCAGKKGGRISKRK
jgi:general stress protein YciG